MMATGTQKPATVNIQRRSFNLEDFGDDPAISKSQAEHPIAAIRLDSAMFEGNPINVTAQIVLRGPAAKVESIVAAIKAIMENETN